MNKKKNVVDIYIDDVQFFLYRQIAFEDVQWRITLYDRLRFCLGHNILYDHFSSGVPAHATGRKPSLD